MPLGRPLCGRNHFNVPIQRLPADFLAFVRKERDWHHKVKYSEVLPGLSGLKSAKGMRSSCFLSSPFQIFFGNQNHDTPEMRSFGTLVTRFVRIYPEKATTEGLGLRLELLGCDLDGEHQLQNVPLKSIEPCDLLIFETQQVGFDVFGIFIDFL